MEVSTQVLSLSFYIYFVGYIIIYLYLYFIMEFVCRSYRSGGPGCNTEDLGEKLTLLKKEISKLEDYEQTLDRHKAWIQQSITNITDDIDSRQYLYLNEQDLYEAFGDTQIIPIKAPIGTELDVPVIIILNKSRNTYK